MQDVTDIDMLQQTINIQSCLMAGHSIEAIFRNESHYIFEESGADMGGLCILQKDSLQLEFILEKSNIFHGLLKRYHLQSHTLVLDTLKKKNAKAFTAGEEYTVTDSIEDLLIDSISKQKIKHFEESHAFNHMVVFPLFSFEQQIIGCIFFGFLGASQPEIEKLTKIKKMIETVIRPFHDEKTRMFQGKCIQINNDIPLLTAKEKHILKKLLAAKSYSDIAKEMHISVNTVKTHVKHIYAKYEVNSKLELANKVNAGLLS
ncbi:hypothetical protein THMIRHAM_10960 [Thiomicrorhabdus immobilis]|uniref:HTH luxR-type domain-containing protein n=1 Tax=Thiomicrorhabdus immobilis TaxID=2791037 RepID=A0ABM7MD24_9GAMM|nr:LuxR C-terminal-related transcriptional regulator [Thiomicrorhabdus immobilis]BCN93311.1 hypothetical protein THMIRHAM_10960 [Thiomicrorhabdus immobilis]